MTPEVISVCVNYHNDTGTLEFVTELLEQETSLAQRVIIVDNNECSEGNCGTSRLENFSREHPDVDYYRPGGNLGYYGAAKWGVSRYLEAGTLPEWIIVSNTDISFENRSFIATMAETFRFAPPAVVAPSIISRVSGRDQNPFMRVRPGRLRMHAYKVLFRFDLPTKAYGYMSRLKHRAVGSSGQAPPHVAARIYAPHGAYVIFNRRYFEAGGTLEYLPFLFDEEIFVAETARRLWLDVVYEPRLKVIHEEHVTTGISGPMREHKYDAARYCADNYFPWGA